MLIPRRVKYRKQHHPKRGGAAKGGTKVSFGDYGIQATEPAYITNRQIEAARIAMTRYIKRGGKVWINIYPDRPLTKKPAETRIWVRRRGGSPMSSRVGSCLNSPVCPRKLLARRCVSRSTSFRSRPVSWPAKVVSEYGNRFEEPFHGRT